MSTSDSPAQPAEKATSKTRPQRKKKRKKERTFIEASAPPEPASSSWLTRPVIIALVLGIAAGGAGGFYAGQSYRPTRAQRPEPGPAYIELATWSPRRGPDHAKVTIVLFSDFQCPFCARVGPTIEKIVQTYKDDVAIVYRHKPLPMHPHARPAAIAMQAAMQQGKAWELHDKMFENYKTLTPETIEQHAAAIGLDMEKFKAAMSDPKLGEQVDSDAKAADEAQASGTPTLFVNGRRVRGARPFDDFKRIIDEEIKKADELLAKGTPIAKIYDELAKNQKTN